MSLNQPKKDEIESFFRAIDRTDLKSIEKFHAKGISTTIRDEHGDTALHKAAAKGDDFLVNLLITRYHYDIEGRNRHNRNTPIHEAVMFGSMSTVKCLIEKGADVNAQDINESTVVHKAIRLRNKALIIMLIDASANLNEINVFAHTPISLAVLDVTDYDLSRLLLQNGASVHVHRGMYLLHEAILNYFKTSQLPLIYLLVTFGADPRHIDALGRNAIHYVAINGSTVLLNYFLEKACPANIKDVTQRTPFEIARAHGNKNVASILQTR